MGMPVIEPVRIDPEYAATALLQSIALEETALSHIINAEGEKLQKGMNYSAMIKSLNFDSPLSDENITASVKLIFDI